MDVLETTDVRTTGTSQQPWTWVRVARIGGGAFVISSVVMVAAGAPIVSVAPVALVFAVFTALLSAQRRRLAIAFLAIAGAVLGLNLVFAIADLGHPESAPSFIPQLFSVLALTVTVVGALGVVMRWSPGAARPVVLGTAGVLVVAIVGSLLAWNATTSDTQQAGDTPFGVEAFAWESDTVAIDPATSQALWIDNRDGGRHVLAVPDLDVAVELPAWRARRVELGDVPAGEYAIVCTIPGHESMTATLVVGDSTG
jgi:plastocyanin